MADLKITSQTITSKMAMLKLAGDADAGNFHVLEEEIGVFLETGVPGLLLDLSCFGTATSSALGAFVNLSTVLADRGGKLVLAAPSEGVAGLLDLLGLAETLVVKSTLDEGRKALAAAIK